MRFAALNGSAPLAAALKKEADTASINDLQRTFAVPYSLGMYWQGTKVALYILWLDTVSSTEDSGRKRRASLPSCNLSAPSNLFFLPAGRWAMIGKYDLTT